VKTPQLYPVFGRISLQDLLAQAGGVADDAGSTVSVTRGTASRSQSGSGAGSTGGNGEPTPGPATVTVNLQKLLEGGDPSANLDVYPGDRVTVQRAGVVYVLGAVNKAGGYLLSDARQNMTALKALALAGYLSPFAKPKKAMLLRPDSSAPGGREQIPINLQAMLKGNVPDRPLSTDDILFIPDSTALKALHKSADVAAQTAGLAVIYH
jgi:polysaccharide export outer membrane protein